jgi:hypothetical protein
MAAQNMTDDLKHPYPDVPFSTIGDDTISALATLAEIFTRNFKKVDAPEIPLAPVKAAIHKQPEALVHPKLTSPLKHQYQTRFQKQVSPTAQKLPQPPRVVTPATWCVAPPTVPTGARRVSPRNLS